MDNALALSKNTPIQSVNLASRMTWDEAEAFMKEFNSSIDFGNLGPVQIRYFHRSTQRWYRVTATPYEMREEQLRLWLQRLADLFGWATLEEKEEPDLSGRLLGVSGRVDGVRACDVDKAVGMANTPSSTTDSLAPVSWHPNGPVGDLAKIPKELRYKVYKHTFPRTFWQCYHTKLPGITLLGMTHSSRLPGIMSASEAVREEVIESAFCNKSLVVTVGSEVIAFNFPLIPSLQAGQTLDITQATIPVSAELFIGIQVPSPRSAVEMDAVRVNVGRVVDLLNAIATKQNLPPIHVSFKTNQETANLQYYDSDFELLMGPLRSLRIANRNPDIKSKQPLVIDRCPPYGSGDRVQCCGAHCCDKAVPWILNY
jgi:hypothetical protein